MKLISHTFRMLCVLGGLVTAGVANEAVLPPAKRIETLTVAKTLLNGQAAPDAAKDPFSTANFEETLATNAGRTVGPLESSVATPAPTGNARTDRDVLRAIAASLKPNLMVMGGQPNLIFGQKRVKAGGSLTITYEGTEYVLEIVSIERPNFTLRLNREEFTRPIK